MPQPTFDPTRRASRAAAHRVGRGAVRLGARLATRLIVSSALCVPAGALLMAHAAQAEEAGGPIVIPGPGEKNPAALAELAEHMQTTPAKRAGTAATLAAATAQSLKAGPAARDADQFTRAANASGSIVIPGAGEAPAAPQMIRTSFKPDANGVVTIPAAGGNAGAREAPAAPQMVRTGFRPDANGVVTIPAAVADPAAGLAKLNVAPGSRQLVPVVVTPAPKANSARQAAGVQPVAANAPGKASLDVPAGAPAPAGFDTLASRGEPPQFGANGKPIVTRTAAVPAPASIPAPMPAALARTPATRQATASAAARNPRAAQPMQVAQAAQAAQPMQAAPLPGQQDPEAIRNAALAFLQQQSAGLPGKVEITVAPAFPRGLAACSMIEPFMPSGARLWGRMTVGVRCAGEKPWTIYLQARISLRATYYLAARAMAPGEVLNAADLVARDGDLTGLPQAIVTDPSQAVGSVTLTRVAAGMPLRRDMLKSASAVSIGQTVRVVAAGEGFAISAEGSAMNNASPGQQVRVKTANGQVISGVVKDGATVEIQL
ncbi:flagellar basal body P-ring formation chaperone FlgA [Paraburkholderia terricola]|uniref:flagellar basal body P-ring formation chaperone FlgA n=1 Tax=Paraburkholderia terricola TaxID=169427 RepID=UPI000DEFAFCB|nr:flagellar basal body P-ring formation chaperone FlgA [Paraburkholderia terricola]AXE93909.1 flagellar basal body P-ring formation protein FlgA [Paraburkholderia terricola]